MLAKSPQLLRHGPSWEDYVPAKREGQSFQRLSTCERLIFFVGCFRVATYLFGCKEYGLTADQKVEDTCTAHIRNNQKLKRRRKQDMPHSQRPRPALWPFHFFIAHLVLFGVITDYFA